MRLVSERGGSLASSLWLSVPTNPLATPLPPFPLRAKDNGRKQTYCTAWATTIIILKKDKKTFLWNSKCNVLRFYIDWEQKIYIFFKKEIKRHTEMVCRIVKGSNVMNNNKMKKKVLTNRFIRRIKQAPRALVSKNVHYPFLRPLISALTMQAKTNSCLWYQ